MAKKEYIERNATIEQIRVIYCGNCNSYNGVRCRACEFDDAMSLVEDAPTADVVEVVHGEWIFDFELDGSNFYKCSVCGRQEVLLAKESTDEYFPYCHCGARMDGGKDDG